MTVTHVITTTARREVPDGEGGGIAGTKRTSPALSPRDALDWLIRYWPGVGIVTDGGDGLIVYLEKTP